MNIFFGCWLEFDPTIDWSGIATFLAVLAALLAVFWPQICTYYSRPFLTIQRKEPRGDQNGNELIYHLVVKKIKGDTARNCRVYLSHMLKRINNKWEHCPVYYKRRYPWSPTQDEGKARDIIHEASFDFLCLFANPNLNIKFLKPLIVHGSDDKRFSVNPNEPTCFIIEIESETCLKKPEKKFVFKVTWNGQFQLPEYIEKPSKIWEDRPEDPPSLTIQDITDNSEIQKMLKEYDIS